MTNWTDENPMIARSVHVWELLPRRGDLVANRRFERCTILGPALLAFINGCLLDGCSFEGNPEALLWEIPEGRKAVLGVVGFSSCEFINCDFRGVGIAGSRESLEDFKKALGESLEESSISNPSS